MESRHLGMRSRQRVVRQASSPLCHLQLNSFKMNINIDIPDEMRVYVEAQLMTGTYNSIGEYFLDLVQQDKKRKAQAKLEMLLLESINFFQICSYD